ncbi:MAG: tripartite tricarboxylate transporter substrate binding protein [Betaproteobacteria bacterium]|nr:tripartite tricarboxylate transporter substrate binding protein [Betaproteobacteria bacterium]
MTGEKEGLEPTKASQSDTCYPAGPLRFVVPYAKGGPGDLMARLVGEKLAKRLGQSIDFENIPGKGGTLGTAKVASLPADGHTLLIMASPHTISPSLYPELPYDTLHDFQGVTLMISMPNVLVVSPSFPADSVSELVEYARANPGKLKYGSGGIGTPSHLGAELLKSMAGLDIGHAQYGGHAEAGEALRKGEVHMLFDAMMMALPELHAGTEKALGVTSPNRSEHVPEIPTIDESGVPGFDFSPGVGVLVRSGTPPEIVNRLYKEIKAILALPEVSGWIAQSGAEIVASDPPEFCGHIAREITKWAKVIAAAGIIAT